MKMTTGWVSFKIYVANFFIGKSYWDLPIVYPFKCADKGVKTLFEFSQRSYLHLKLFFI